ncbi:hypothetical protein BV22DRAFT_1135274 [Leucogyrophana mollusca]|uniref:Uncharacterized protein n=1 Tax=Leucogyrophana mollusca TaxID=85980 RepID=A0ACB8AW41_9AGAM|nr:hypothetical protein BV22DRAFT_1135274 [Leucogyrophana mollusca]
MIYWADGVYRENVGDPSLSTHETMIQKLGFQRGLLIDLDSATWVNCLREAKSPGDQTGTIPFMAIQILYEYACPSGKTKQTAANDLESVIYIMDLSCTKDGQLSFPKRSIIPHFTPYYQPLAPVVEKLYKLIAEQREYEVELESMAEPLAPSREHTPLPTQQPPSSPWLPPSSPEFPASSLKPSASYVELPAPSLELPAPSLEPPAPSLEPPAPSLEPPAPSLEPPAPSPEQPAPRLTHEAVKNILMEYFIRECHDPKWEGHASEPFGTQGKKTGPLTMTDGAVDFQNIRNVCRRET